MKKLLTLGILGAGAAWIYRKFVSPPEDDIWQQATVDPDLR